MSKTREEDQILALYTQALQIMNSIGGNSTFLRESHIFCLRVSHSHKSVQESKSANYPKPINRMLLES